MASTEIKVRIMDMPAFKEWTADVKTKLEQLTLERDEARREAVEWEERYEWLLGEVGGVSPR